MAEERWEGWTVDTALHEVRSPDGAVVCKGLDWTASTWIGRENWPTDYTLNSSMCRVYDLADGHYMGAWWSGAADAGRWNVVTYGDGTMSRRFDPEDGTVKFHPDAAPGAAPTINLVGHPLASQFAKALNGAKFLDRVLPLLDKANTYLFVVSGPGLRALPLTGRDCWGDEGNLSNGVYHILTRNRETGVEIPDVVVGLRQHVIRYVTTQQELLEASNVPVFAAVGLMAMETGEPRTTKSVRRIVLHFPFYVSILVIAAAADPEKLTQHPEVVRAALDVILNDEMGLWQSKKDLSVKVKPVFDLVTDRLEKLLDWKFGSLSPKIRETAEGDYLEQTPLSTISDELLRVWDSGK